MGSKTRKHLRWLLLMLWGVSATPFADDTLFTVYGNEQMMTLATVYPSPVSDAPASAFIVTAEDIQRIGARTIADALEIVPGVHVGTDRGVGSTFFFRGFYSGLGAQFLVMVNGVPIIDITQGGRQRGWDYPVHNIDRIEVALGPQSALYGADAFAGVINIITRTAGGTSGGQFGVYGGSYDTASAWVNSAGRAGRWDLAISAAASTTDGHRAHIAADSASVLDALHGTQSSRAPGRMNTERDDYYVHVDARHGSGIRFWSTVQRFDDLGSGVGIIGALDPDGHTDSDLWVSELSWQGQLNQDIQAQLRASYVRTTSSTDASLLPPGAFGLFDQGLRFRFNYTVDQYRTEGTLIYDGWRNHRSLLGGGYHTQHVRDVDQQRNYIAAPDALGVMPTEGLIRPGGEFSFERSDYYLYAQDEWRLAHDWRLVSGIRLDNFSDTGTTTNPRVALLWNHSSSTTYRLIVGSAFRAPSTTELFAELPLIINGNPDLRPEQVDTLELGVNRYWGDRAQLNIGTYLFDADDLIGIEEGSGGTFVAVNQSGREGYGIDIDGSYRVTQRLVFNANLSLKSARDKDTNRFAGVSPREQVVLEADWRFKPRWSLSTRLHYIGDRRRVLSEQSVDNNVVVNTTLRYDKGRWGLRLNINNVFDSQIIEPDDTILLPGDIPGAGRNILVTFLYRL